MIWKFDSRKIGIAQIILAGCFFGFLGIFGKTAYQNQIEPGELLSLRFLFSSFLLGPLLCLFSPSALRMSWQNFFSSLILGVLGYAVFSSCYFMALQGVSASLTVLLLYTFPVMVTVGARIFFHERIGKKGLLALLASTLGLVLLVWGDWSTSKPIYLLFGFGSAFFYAVYILVSRNLLKVVSPLGSSFYMQLGAGGVLAMLNFTNVERPIDIVSNFPFLIIGMAIVCSLFPLTLFLAGLQKVSPSEASILSTTEPIFAIAIAMIFLQERILPIQMLGGILVLIGMVLVALRKGSS